MVAHPTVLLEADMIHLNIDDYPRDTYNPVNPVWLTINGRWMREPKNEQSYRAKKEDRKSNAAAIRKPITIMTEDGIEHTFNGVDLAGAFMGYTNNPGTGTRASIKNRNSDGWFKARKKWYKYIRGPYGNPGSQSI